MHANVSCCESTLIITDYSEQGRFVIGTTQKIFHLKKVKRKTS